MKKHWDHINEFLRKEIDPGFARRANYILTHLAGKRGVKILEVGCGRGFYEAAVNTIYPKSLIIGMDLNTRYLEVAKRAVRAKNVTFIRGDATKIPFPEKEFDRVICTEVLEHIGDDQKVIAELYRVLKPSGQVLISVPHKNYPFFWDPLNFILERLFHVHVPSHIWWLAGIWADHVRLYTPDEIITKFKKAGFRIEDIQSSTHFCLPFSHFLLYGIGKNLVEKGFVGAGVNRFDFSEEQSGLNKLIQLPFRLFDRLNRPNTRGARYLNILMVGTKTK